MWYNLIMAKYKGKKRAEIRKQLAESGHERVKRRQVKRHVRSAARNSGVKRPSIQFNFGVGDLVRLPDGRVVCIFEVYDGGQWFRFMDPETSQLEWVEGKKIRPA